MHRSGPGSGVTSRNGADVGRGPAGSPDDLTDPDPHLRNSFGRIFPNPFVKELANDVVGEARACAQIAGDSDGSAPAAGNRLTTVLLDRPC